MIGLDHVVLPVHSLDEAGDTLSSAGFVVTPRAEHPFGTANRLVVFERCYLELVTVVDRERLPSSGFARRVSDHIDSGATGFSHVVCASGSVTDAGDSARRHGVDPGEPMRFSRKAPRTDGSELTAAFTLLPLEASPHVFFCVHHTPGALWFDEHLDHPNGARSIRVSTRLDLPFDIDRVERGDDRIETDAGIDPVVVAGVGIR